MYRVVELDLATYPTKTRMPFRYGIAELTAMPHVILRATVAVVESGELLHGVAAEGLLPRWFEKDPDAPFQRDLDRLWEVIHRAGARALEYGRFEQPFHFWLDLYNDQLAWGREQGFPPLLAHFGLTLVERCVLDAVCRGHGRSLSSLLADGTIAVEATRIASPPSAEALSRITGHDPLVQVHARHTVGMADPLTPADVEAPLADGLPECLEQDIEYYGLTHFKVKVRGDVASDIDRLEAVRDIIVRGGSKEYRFTLDGNEQFSDVAAFRAFWEEVERSARLSGFFEHLIFVEQPFKRQVALSEAVAKDLRNWRDAPTMIIDESDGGLEDLPQALETGFAGTSHKNCKGVFKGIVNCARIDDRRRAGEPAVMSAEDLVNIGPVALLQDLAMVAKLGIDNVERNGHHYYRGLSMFPRGIQDRIVEHHGDLYRRHEQGFPELDVRGGLLSLESVNRAPFGVAFVPADGDFVPLADWPKPRAPEGS